MRPYLENTHHKKGLVEWLKVGSEFKHQYRKKKKKKRKKSSKISNSSGMLNYGPCI
jgi:hypothetical protein